MPYRLTFKIILLFAFLSASTAFCAEKLPAPQGWVNDFAGVINQDYTAKLNSLIAELETKTSAEIAVVTVSSISPYEEKEYARLLFDSWKPGKKGKDNGVLILLAINERRWRIETGYGIEGILPDGLSGEIGRNYMVPYFKDKKYSQGLYLGVIKISQIIAKNANIELNIPNEARDLAEIKTGSDNSTVAIIILLVFFFGFVVLPIMFSRGSNNVFLGGGFGGGGFRGGGFGGGGFGGGGFGGGGGGGGGSGGGF